MFVPRYWSQSQRHTALPNGQSFLVRRFGWSAESQAEADTHARQRLEEAIVVARELGTEGLKAFTRLERKAAYAGSDGLPIREEIIRELPSENAVITRNAYGALCLNTPDAMFVDVDAAQSSALTKGCVGGCLLLPLLIGVCVWPLGLGLWQTALASVLGAGLFGWLRHARILRRESRDPRFTDLLGWTVDKAQTWCHERRAWRVLIYETPAGVRLLPLHAPFDAGEDDTYAFMEYVGSDPLYMRMCRIQKCFRARISPKPWRTRFKDRYVSGGTWPVTDKTKLARRAAWTEQYAQVLTDYASCRFIKTVGYGSPHPDIERIRTIHDEYCHAHSRLPLA